MIKKIPLTPTSQTLTISLVGTSYNFQIIWRGNQYILDIFDINNNAIVTGISLVTGVNLMEQFRYLNLGFNMFVSTDITPNLDVNYPDLGVTAHLMVYN